MSGTAETMEKRKHDRMRKRKTSVMRTSIILMASCPVLIAAVAGCLGGIEDDMDDLDPGSNDSNINRGCTRQNVNGQVTPDESLSVQGEAGAVANAQISMSSSRALVVGIGESVELVLEDENGEVWFEDSTSNEGNYNNNAQVDPGNYTLTVSVDQSVWEIESLVLEIAWGGEEC